MVIQTETAPTTVLNGAPSHTELKAAIGVKTPSPSHGMGRRTGAVVHRTREMRLAGTVDLRKRRALRQRATLCLGLGLRVQRPQHGRILRRQLIRVVQPNNGDEIFEVVVLETRRDEVGM